jgi:hypothetical protein
MKKTASCIWTSDEPRPSWLIITIQNRGCVKSVFVNVWVAEVRGLPPVTFVRLYPRSHAPILCLRRHPTRCAALWRETARGWFWRNNWTRHSEAIPAGGAAGWRFCVCVDPVALPSGLSGKMAFGSFYYVRSDCQFRLTRSFGQAGEILQWWFNENVDTAQVMWVLLCRNSPTERCWPSVPKAQKVDFRRRRYGGTRSATRRVRLGSGMEAA